MIMPDANSSLYKYYSVNIYELQRYDLIKYALWTDFEIMYE